MRRLLLAVVLLSACSTPAGVVSTTAATPVTQPVEPMTTLAPRLAIEIRDCTTPPVTFSPLCETYELIDQWHVDAPIDPDALAAEAVEGIEGFETEITEEPPRELQCAIPHESFTILCDEIARRVIESRIPVGPAVESAIAHMIDAALDPFTYYLPPDQAGAVRANGIVGGVGLLLDARDAAGSKCARVSEACRLEIVTVLEDNPGSIAGLVSGDVITAVDGETVEGLGFADVVSAIAGDETGVVMITVERDGAELDFEVERAELDVPTVEVGLHPGDVGYLRIPDFEEDIPFLVSHALSDLDESDPGTLVVDLRDNPGGYVDVVIEIADEFIEDGVLMVSDTPDDHVEYEATPGGAATDPRLVVLVNQGTASAAEVLAGALRDRRNATIVGTSTFGKNAVQIPFTLRNGGELHVAVARWSTPDGDSAGDGGLTPDREVVWPTDVSTDELVEIALEAAS